MGDRVANFLNKKPWHPNSFRNQEKTWLAEQKAEKEETLCRERREEIRKEKEEEESRSSNGWVRGEDNLPEKPPAATTAPTRRRDDELLARTRPTNYSSDEAAARRAAAAELRKDAEKRTDEKRKAENAEKRRRKKAKKWPPPAPPAPPPREDVRVRFVTKQASLAVPDTALALATTCRREQLGDVVNKLRGGTALDLDFLWADKLVQGSLAQHAARHGLSTENVAELEYFKRAPEAVPPAFANDGSFLEQARRALEAPGKER